MARKVNHMLYLTSQTVRFHVCGTVAAVRLISEGDVNGADMPVSKTEPDVKSTCQFFLMLCEKNKEIILVTVVARRTNLLVLSMFIFIT